MNSRQPHRRSASGRFGVPLFLSLLICGAWSASAQVQEYDGFNYVGTALNAQNGGTGWGANVWTNTDGLATLSNDGVSLTFPGSVTHSGAGSRITFTGAGIAERRLNTSLNLAAEGSTFYFSCLVKRQGYFKIEFWDNTVNARWRIGATNDGPNSLLGVSGDGRFANQFPIGETVFLVGKLLTHATANDEVFLNTYRAGDVVPTLEPAVWQATTNGGSGVVLTRLRIQNFDGLPLEVDEIRVGASYQAVAAPLASGSPIVTVQPVPATSYEGLSVQFSAEATGALPLGLQWRKDGTPLTGQTNLLLKLPNVTAGQSGNYSLSVSNSLGTTNSNPALLTVLAATNVNLGLKALWHFDEKSGLTAFDATTNHNDGTLFNYVGDNSQWIASDYNGALDFNRSISNYVDVPHSASIGANLANGFSVTAWIRSKVDLLNNGATYRVLEKENTFFLLQGTGANGGMNLLVKKGGANIVAGIGDTLFANRWYHLAGTFDGTTLRMYLDGVLKTNVACAAPIDTSTLPMRIGSDYVANGPGSLFNGAVDEVGVWERPLSQSEILQLSGQSGPPQILDQPQPLSRYVGGSAVLTLRARGQQPLRYLWYHGTNELRNATTTTLQLVNLQASDAGDYYCKVSNDRGETNSATATLTVALVNSITDGMQAQYKMDDGSGLTAEDASGQLRSGQLVDFPDSTSQWISGQVNGALNFDGISNRVVVSNSAAMNLGSDATLAFWIRPSSYGSFQDAVTFTRHQGRILRKGGHFDVEIVDDPGSVRATIRANGVPAAQNSLQTNQWQHFAVVYQAGTVTFYKNGFRLGNPVAGALGAGNTNLLVLGNVDEGLVSSNYFAGGMDEVGIWARPLSESEILTLAGQDASGPPVVVTQPKSITRYVGGTADFLVEATGKRPVSYEWRHGSAPLPNSNTNHLVLTNLTLGDSGSYTVQVQNEVNTITSAPPATLTVLEITNVATGLVAYWTFDETNGTVFSDASGHGHNATLQNGTIVSGTPGVVGGAYSFDGVDDFAIVPNASELNLADQVSISAWVNPRTMTFTGGLGRIVRKDINYDFTLVTAGSTFELIGQNKIAYLAPNNTVATNQWQHLAVVVKNGTIQLFKNGRSLGPPVPGQLGPDNLNDLIIGNFGPDLSINRLFSGAMDELGLWNRALSDSEVDGIYQNGLVARGLNAPYVPFAIQKMDFPNASQVRLVFFSPYNNLAHGVQRKTDLGAASWDDETQATLTQLGGGLIQAVFNKPAADGAFYRIVALPKPPIFAENFETGAPGWTHGGNGDSWEVGVPVNGPAAAFQGTNVYATSLTGNIQPFSSCYLRSPSINLAGIARATLTLEEWRNVDPDPTFHGTIVNVLDASTLSVISQLSLQAGSSGGWQPLVLPLPPQALGKNVVLEFRLYCDNFNLLEGWYIDDVKLLPQ